MKIIEKELEQAIESIRTQIALTVNVLTALVIADVTLIGYSISVKSAGIFMIGAILPFTMLIIGKTVKRLMVPVAFTAIYLEFKYGDKKDSYLAITFISYLLSQEKVKKLIEISTVEDYSKRIQLLKKFDDSFHWSQYGIIFKLILIILFGQVIVPLFLYLFFQWSIF